MSCSTGGHIAVLGFSPYYSLLKYAPAILAILKETHLARSFNIMKVYETFTSSLCANCGQFGGYVFLPSFTRCCLDCAETNLKFLPISRKGAETEFGVKGKRIFYNLPQLAVIQGLYSSGRGTTKQYSQNLTLFSRELVEELSNPNHVHRARHSWRNWGNNSRKMHQRYMALTPLPCFIPKSASIEEGLYCASCALKAKYSHTAKHSLHDSRHVLAHLQGCVATRVRAQSVVKKLQKRKSKNLFNTRRKKAMDI